MALSLEARLIGWALGLAALLGCAWFLVHRGEEIADARSHAAVIAQQKEDAAISAKRVQNLSEIANDATVQADRARVAAASAAHARDALRMQLNAYVARAANPPASAASAANEPAVSVLAKLFLEARDFAAEVAADADASRIAGQACERAYDGLTK